MGTIECIYNSSLYDRKLQICWPDAYHKENMNFAFISIDSFRNVSKNSSKIIPSNNYGRNMFKDIRKIIRTDPTYKEKSITYADDTAYFFEVCSNPKHYDRLLTLGLTKQESVDEARAKLSSLTDITDNDVLLESIYKIGKIYQS